MRRETPTEWDILLVHAKEREMKKDPRLFAMMVLARTRLYFCVTEANLAKHLTPYSPQKTMTLSEIDLTHRLLILTQEQEGPSPLFPLYLNLDFVKWNLQWRAESTVIFGAIDQMFGTPGLLTLSMSFFK